jgi:hemerythrin
VSAGDRGERDEDAVHWSDEYSVGFGVIDDQHKKLVRMTNSLFEGCRRGSAAADEALMRTIREAVEYAQTHFYTEERYMRETAYPGLEDHKKEHEAFVSTVMAAVNGGKRGRTEALSLARFLKKWLLNHIAGSDQGYAPYLAGLPGGGGEPPGDGGA